MDPGLGVPSKTLRGNMHECWKTLLEPLLSRLQPGTIVEVGCGKGQTTYELLRFCVRHGAVLHAIDAQPEFDVASWQKKAAGKLVFHQRPPLEVLAALDRFEVVFLGGDPNWYTVFHQLKCIDERCEALGQPFPLVLCRHTGWPYGRRDFYPSPGAVPEQFRHASARMGVRPGSSPLQEKGGWNPCAWNAVPEGGPRNGVLTGVEDFLKACKQTLRLLKVPGLHGLGILVPAGLAEQNPELGRFLKDWDLAAPARAHVEQLELHWITQLLATTEDAVQVLESETTRLRECVQRLQNPRSTPLLETTRTRNGASHRETNGASSGVVVSIIIPVFNQVSFTRNCLAALYQNTSGEDPFETIVVDNGSSDETPRFLEAAVKKYPRLRVVTPGQNLGFARGCNLGAEAAAGEHLLFLNNDTEVQPGWLRPLVAIVRRDPAVGAIGAKLLFPNGTIQHAGILFALHQGHPAGNELDIHCLYRKRPAYFPDANQARVYPCVTGACLLTPRALFTTLAGFDEGYWNGAEDADYCLRVVERKRLVVYEPACVAIHFESQSGPERERMRWENATRFRATWQNRIPPEALYGHYVKEGRFYLERPLRAYVLPPVNTRANKGTSPSQQPHLIP
jgi:GT2 family glycosyltransferase